MLERKCATEKTRTLVQPQFLLHHDNALAHTFQKTTEFVMNDNIVNVPHPPFSPDLSPCDFALFPKLNNLSQHFFFDLVRELSNVASCGLAFIFTHRLYESLGTGLFTTEEHSSLLFAFCLHLSTLSCCTSFVTYLIYFFGYGF
jgi:hypothetical protein